MGQAWRCRVDVVRRCVAGAGQVLFMRYKVLPEKGVHDVVMRRNGPLGVSVRVGFAPKGEVLEKGGRY